MLVSVHGGISGGVVAGLVSPNSVRQTSPASSPGIWVRCHARWVAIVCHGFVTVILSDFSVVIVLNWIARVFIEGWFASARMASTAVVRSWPVIARPTQYCDLPRFSSVEFNIHGSRKDVLYSTFERSVAMDVAYRV